MYDAIVVGARCAGAPTAMLLARAGHRVLLCDRASFPSDTVSNGMFNAPGPPYLRRWGLLDRLVATGCPAISGGFVAFADGRRRPIGWASPTYAPRRTVLDHLLVQAAVEAGVELRERFRVTGLVDEDGRVAGVRSDLRDGTAVVERARIVVGADGRRSTVASLVGARERMRRNVSGGGVYAYYSDLPAAGYEFYVGGALGGAIVGPSNDGLTHVTAWRNGVRGTPEERMGASIEAFPELSERVKAARRETRLVVYRDDPVYLRDAFGDGWALVGDAGFHQGPYSGYGMSHAFRDADALARRLDEWLRGDSSDDEALRGYASDRDDFAVPFAEWVDAAIRSWEAGAEAPSEWPIVERWLARIRQEDSTPGGTSAAGPL